MRIAAAPLTARDAWALGMVDAMTQRGLIHLGFGKPIDLGVAAAVGLEVEQPCAVRREALQFRANPSCVVWPAQDRVGKSEGPERCEPYPWVAFARDVSSTACYTSRWTVLGENAGRHTATYSAPSAPGVL